VVVITAPRFGPSSHESCRGHHLTIHTLSYHPHTFCFQLVRRGFVQPGRKLDNCCSLSAPRNILLIACSARRDCSAALVWRETSDRDLCPVIAMISR
jgi:hypothetical protein